MGNTNKRETIINKVRIAASNNIFKFLSEYVAAREKGFDITEEASKFLVNLGGDAFEKVAKTLNDKSNSDNFRGTISHLLMITIGQCPKLPETDTLKKELKQALSDSDYFVAFNAAESLISLDITDIAGTPTREYARKLRDQKLNEDWNSMFIL